MKKTNGNDEFKDFHSDPEFRRVVFSEHYQNGSTASAEKNGTASKEKQIPAPEIWKSPTDGSTRLGKTILSWMALTLLPHFLIFNTVTVDIFLMPRLE